MTDTTSTDSASGDNTPDHAAPVAPYSERPRNFFVRSAGGGRVLSALMLPDFMLVPPTGFGVLTTTGRRTGKPRRKCVRAIRTGEKVYLVMLGPPLTGNPKGRLGVAMEHPRRSERYGSYPGRDAQGRRPRAGAARGGAGQGGIF
jgi:hypothetical protein